MEAIKFSELPTGDRMPLADEDGVPIIANQENRLLTWGRLKQQLAEQTHTKTVEDDDTKVPTAKAVFSAITSATNDAANNLTTAKAELDEQIGDAQAKAEGADTTAKSAFASAGSASRDAQSAENKATEALAKAEASAGDLVTIEEKISGLETAQTTTGEALNPVVLSKSYQFQYHTDPDTGAITIIGRSESSVSSEPVATDLVTVLTTIINNQASLYQAICVLTDLVNSHENFNDDLQADLATFMTELKAQMSLVTETY